MMRAFVLSEHSTMCEQPSPDLDFSWMSNNQKKLYNIISLNNNALLSQSQLRSQFGFTRHEIEGAVLDSKFKVLWEALRIKQNPFVHFTSSYEQRCLEIAREAQGKEVLQIEDIELRTMHVKRLGYTWPVIQYHREFVKTLIQMGVDIPPVPKTCYQRMEDVDTAWMSSVQKTLFSYMQNHPTVYIKSKEQVSRICACAATTAVCCFADSRFFDIITLHNQAQGRIYALDREQKMYDYYMNERNLHIPATDAALKLFGTRHPWYQIKQNKEFVHKLESLGVTTKSLLSTHAGHDAIDLITSQQELEGFFKSDCWDMRRILKDYPRHRSAATYCIDFSGIPQKSIRESVKRYFRIQVSTVWKARTGNCAMVHMAKFFRQLFNIYPEIKTLKDLSREPHILSVIGELRRCCSDHNIIAMLTTVRAFFHFSSVNSWEDAPHEGLILTYDLPKQRYVKKPKPISTYVKAQFDALLETQILPALRNDIPPPYASASEWDFLILLRYTGRRSEDIAHLLEDCVRLDNDGDPTLFVDQRIAKISKDLHVPLAHLNGLDLGKNIVVEAIQRQQKRVALLGVGKDGYPYLFRKIHQQRNGHYYIDVLSHRALCTSLTKIAEKANIRNRDGSIAKITTHQFRHTVASELIVAGVDVYAVKEFLGHDSVRMTESYIKVLTEELKLKLPDSIYPVLQTPSLQSSSESSLFSERWVKEKIIGVFELGDGCCEHPYKLPSCPHMACKTCIKKKVYPRHKAALLVTIESTKAHLIAAEQLGLTHKVEELEHVLSFHEEALEIIQTGQVFNAADDYYKKRGL